MGIVLGGGGLWEVIRYRRGHEGRVPIMGLVPLEKRKRHQNFFSMCTHTKKRPYEDTVRGWLSVTQEGGPHLTLNLPAP